MIKNIHKSCEVSSSLNAPSSYIALFLRETNTNATLNILPEFIETYRLSIYKTRFSSASTNLSFVLYTQRKLNNFPPLFLSQTAYYINRLIVYFIYPRKNQLPLLFSLTNWKCALYQKTYRLFYIPTEISIFYLCSLLSQTAL